MGDRRSSGGEAGAQDTQPQSQPPGARGEPSIRVLSTKADGPHPAAHHQTSVARGTLASTNMRATDTKVEEALDPGELVDHFQIMRLLGRGGMGEVYVARDTKLGRKVALKVIHPKYLGSPDAIAGFLAEARTTAKFSHPHIVTIHGVGEHQGRPYVALEYLEGENLRARMLQRRLSMQAIMRIALAVAEALEEAHRGGVLHLDLKPENVMIPEDGRVRVVDFGLARPAAMMESGEVRASDDQTGVWGTPAYMAPEQWQRKQPTAATDVWGLGLMLFELSSDWLPYDLEGSKTKLMGKVCDPEPVPRIERFAEVPTDVADLIASCLEKDPRRRPKVVEVADALRELLFRGATRPAEDEGPFRGLLPFTERHAGLFFGRESEVAAFVERARLQPVLPVVGPSGAGKSSFVRAGVLPRLREEREWLFITMRPGAHPFDSLAARLVRADRDTATIPPPPKTSTPSLKELPSGEVTSSPGLEAADARRLADELRQAPGRLALELARLAHEHDAKVLLFVDQVEELFTLGEDAAERRAFMEAICTAADDPDDPARVIFTVRDDFLGRLAMGDIVTRALTNVTVIQHLRREALAETLTRPLSSVGYRFEDDELVEEMVDAVADAPGALPMLQFAARQLWERRDNVKRVLLRGEYVEMGGVEGALATHADGVLDGMSAAQLRAAREILLRLVTDDGTRERISKSECIAGLRDEAEAVLSMLTQARLVVTTKKRRDADAETMLELAHDSLITSWGTLERWLEQSREELVFVHEAGQAAALWDKRGRNPQELWRGPALASALRMLDRTTTEVPALTASFLAAAQERELSRGRRRRWLYGIVLFLSALIAAVFAVVAWVVREKGREATAQRDLAEKRRAATLRESARASLSQGSVLEARAKLRLALSVEDDPAARALWWQLSEHPLFWRAKLADRAFGVAFTSSGDRVAAGCADGAVYVFDVTTRKQRLLHGNGDQVLDLATSPTGDVIATVSTGGPVRIWDLDTGLPRSPLIGHENRPTDVRFSPDGKRVATSANDGTVRLWDVAANASLRVYDLGGEVGSVDFHPDGGALAAGTSQGLVLLDGDERVDVAIADPSQIHVVRYSPSGERIASGRADGRIGLWRQATEEQLVLEGHDGAVWALAFTEDGSRLLSAGHDGVLRVWDARSGSLIRKISAHDKQITGVDVRGDGRWVATSGFDGTVKLWDLEADGDVPAPPAQRAGARGLAFSPDGATLASGSYDGRIRLWRVKTGKRDRELGGHSGRIYEVAFSPDGELLASTSADYSARLWDVRSGRQTRVLVGHSGPVVGVSFSPDGGLLATGSKDTTVRLWDLEAGGHRVVGEHDSEIGGVAFSPDGKHLAAAARSVFLWNVGEGKLETELEGHEGMVLGLSFGPRGRQLATGSTDGTIRLWDLASGQGRIVGRHPQRVYWMDMHGGRISASSSDGIARIWGDSGEPLELVGHGDEVNNAVFSPDGTLVATASDDGTIRVWDAETGRPYWRAPVLLTDPLRVLTHRGWTDPQTGEPAAPPTSAWRSALEERARWAQKRDDVICMLSDDGRVELWQAGTDTRIAEAAGPFTTVAAHARGCLMRSSQGAELLSANVEPIRLKENEDVTAIGVTGDRFAVVAGATAHLFDSKAKALETVTVRQGVSAIALLDEGIVVGHRDGHIELMGAPREGVAFQDVVSSRVVRIALGPAGTVAVGYESGLVGLWSLRDGSRLASARLHGRVSHLLVDDRRLVAASDLGDVLVWKLDAFHRSYCEVLRDVWAHVPVVWDGRPVARPAPREHPCSP